MGVGRRTAWNVRHGSWVADAQIERTKYRLRCGVRRRPPLAEPRPDEDATAGDRVFLVDDLVRGRCPRGSSRRRPGSGRSPLRLAAAIVGGPEPGRGRARDRPRAGDRRGRASAERRGVDRRLGWCSASAHYVPGSRGRRARDQWPATRPQCAATSRCAAAPQATSTASRHRARASWGASGGASCFAPAPRRRRARSTWGGRVRVRVRAVM